MRIKRSISLFLVNCMVITLVSFALPAKATVVNSGSCGDNVSWALTDDGTLTIAGTGTMSTSTPSPWFDYRKSITTLLIEDGVTSISDAAFQNCINLRNVRLPESITRIGAFAFTRCTSLTSIILPSELTKIEWSTFGECTSLSEVVLPEKLNSIEREAFYGCSNLHSIILPESLNSIGIKAFFECNSLKSIILPDHLWSIGHSAFYGCSSLEKIVIPENTHTIDDCAFSHCIGLTSIALPKRLSEISAQVFYGCINLKSIVLPENLYTIGTSAFRDCNSLTSIVLPESLTSIGSEAFSGCTNLTSIVIPGKITCIEDHTFSGCTSLASIVIPTSVTQIRYEAFNGCKKITDVYFGGDAERWSALDYHLADTIYVHYNCASSESHWKKEYVESEGCEGVYTREICACGYERIETIIPPSHQYSTTVTAPTCTERGYVTYTCINCNDSFIATYVDALGHDYIGTVLEPTCESGGYNTNTCSRCGDSYVSDYTEPVNHSYENGHCRWCGKGEPTAKFTTISTSLGGNIAMNFYLELSEDLVSDPDAYIQFTYAGKTLNVPLSEGVLSGGVYRFACPITAKNMTDEITAQVYNGNGPVGDSKTMDVATYCNWVIANYTDAKTVNLMKAMLNYGASAQLLFKYRTNDLANAALAESDKVLGKVDASAYIHSRTGEEEGIKPDNYTLLLDSETTVRVYFKLTGDKTIDEYTFTVDGVEVEPVFKDGLYYIQKTDIGAHRLDELHVFTCGGITITYGGLSYVNQVMTYYTEGTTFDMASALFAYSKAAEEYIG